MSLLSSTSICSDKVVDPGGDKLGDIKDLMIDCDSARVHYAVLEFGGFLGMGAKLFAVPMEALRLDRENKCFILDADKDRLKDAPGFDKDHWPDFADPTFADSLHAYYGTTRY